MRALSLDVECLEGREPSGRRPTLAEGIAVKNVGKLTAPIVRALVADVLLVEEAQLERAVNAFLTLQKTMAEGAGAAGLAALLANPERFAGRKVGLDPVRRQHRPAHSSVHHGARAGA
jgi:threonine dehydratase